MGFHILEFDHFPMCHFRSIRSWTEVADALRSKCSEGMLVQVRRDAPLTTYINFGCWIEQRSVRGLIRRASGFDPAG